MVEFASILRLNPVETGRLDCDISFWAPRRGAKSRLKDFFSSVILTFRSEQYTHYPLYETPYKKQLVVAVKFYILLLKSE